MTRTFWAREHTLRHGHRHTQVYGFSSHLRRSLWVDAAAHYRYDDWRREEARATDPDIRSIARSPDYDLWASLCLDPETDWAADP